MCDGCSILGSREARVCERRGPGPSPGQLQAGMAAGLLETTVVFIFLPSAQVRAKAGNGFALRLMLGWLETRPGLCS